jgi:hypothetical protein
VVARHAAPEGGIDIALRPATGGMGLVVAGEGTRSGDAPGGNGAEGLELRLTLVRQMMQAHDGRLEIEARQDGMRVALVFPAKRLQEGSTGIARARETRKDRSTTKQMPLVTAGDEMPA